MEHSEQAAYTYLDGVDHSIKLIQENPRIGKLLWSQLPHRRRHVTSRGWEIIYDGDEEKNCIILIDIKRGVAAP